MSPDEMQRMMQFLLNQQAQFAADCAKSQERFDAGLGKLSDGLIGLTHIVGQIASAQQRTDEQLRKPMHGCERPTRGSISWSIWPVR